MVHRITDHQLLSKLKLTVGIVLFLLLSKSYAFVLSDQLPLIENTEWVDPQNELSLTNSSFSSLSLFLPKLKAAPTVFYTALIGSNKTLLLGRSPIFSWSKGLSFPTPSNRQLLQWLHRRSVPRLGIY